MHPTQVTGLCERWSLATVKYFNLTSGIKEMVFGRVVRLPKINFVMNFERFSPFFLANMVVSEIIEGRGRNELIITCMAWAKLNFHLIYFGPFGLILPLSS
jgi:hypothetical protein